MDFATLNKPFELEVVLINTLGDFASGETITYEIRKSSDDSLITSGSLTEQTNVYTDTYTFTANGQFRVIYTTPSGFENGFDHILVQDADLSDLNVKICSILGLSQSNYRLNNTVYTPDGCLLSATITIYPTATDACDETNPIEAYEMTSVYDTEGLLIDYKVVKL